MGKIAMGVVDYHERTKHWPKKFAAGPGELDFNNQPLPFSSYQHVPVTELPLIKEAPEGSYSDLYDRGGKGKDNGAQSFTKESIGAFLELSLGLSAWKSLEDSSWALRCNPSSGNLHPTEAHLILPPMIGEGDAGGVYHYNPYGHQLEERASFDAAFYEPVAEEFKTPGFFIGLTSIYWREAWKYGERAFRYSNLDIGHALAALSFSASLNGWQVTALNKLSHDDIDRVLGLDKVAWEEGEHEESEILCYVHEAGALGVSVAKEVPRDISPAVIESFSGLDFYGVPQRLSAEHVKWDAVYEVIDTTRKPTTMGQWIPFKDTAYINDRKSVEKSGADIIKQRRSAQAYDGKAEISKEEFFAILDRTVPRKGNAPFDIGVSKVRVHFFIMVHNVTGLEPGIYCFLRDEKVLEEVQKRTDFGILWERVKETPKDFHLYLLDKKDFRELSKKFACNQDIASDGPFAISMVAQFMETIERSPYRYRDLYWEAGMIGQILYLEAEAVGLRGTGIGCFQDDSILAILNIMDNYLQNFYWFTVGKPVEDERISTNPPYLHLKAQGRS
ncbi:MAG: SagB family peptide dehydrogenase [Proteobacteria bacterium]|nr:SagB family peptide dehydrogenase [Pseudomonadota bacterium]